MDVPDEVRKQLDIEAPIQRVWDALTTPEGLLAWLPSVGAEIELRPGGRLSLVWADDADEGGLPAGRLHFRAPAAGGGDAVHPPPRSVVRWRPAGTARPHTTVAFSLEDLDGRTRLTLVESGFASLPDRIRLRSWEGNDLGWSEELAELKTALEAA